MDEYSSGMDPEVTKHFRKIVNSFFLGLIWLMAMMILGLFFGFGIVHRSLRWINIVYFAIMLSSLVCLLGYYRALWGRTTGKIKPQPDQH